MAHRPNEEEPEVTAEQIPAGFRFAAVRAGIKPSGKPDFACAVAEQASAAAMFTSNRTVAAPVVVGREHLVAGGSVVRVLAVNAGNANCATGEPGLAACRAVCDALAEKFSCAPQQVFPSSTGIIGVPLPAEKLVRAIPQIEKELGATPEHLRRFAEAILTTDTRVKFASATVATPAGPVRIAGVAKGAGMIAPQLVPHATMLSYIFTDALVSPSTLQATLKPAVEATFNCISIDGDTSTNDTVLLLASGASGVTIEAGSTTAEAFAAAVHQVCSSLARQIVEDGEGAEHLLVLHVTGAASFADARAVAGTIANSPLVKTAFAGCDPNWGRILAAAGRSGVALDPANVSVSIAGMPVCRNGQIAAEFSRDRVHAAMREWEVPVSVDLGMGEASCTFYTCDLTAEYVHINADYST